jgi:hypothetical protein
MPLNLGKLVAGGQVYSYGNQSPAADAVPLAWTLPSYRVNVDPLGAITPALAGVRGWQLTAAGTPGTWVEDTAAQKAIITYDFSTINANSSATLFEQAHWLAMATSDQTPAGDAKDELRRPFALANVPDGKLVGLEILIVDGDAAIVDSGTWQWTFTIYKDGVATIAQVPVVTTSAGTSGLFGNTSFPIAWPGGQGLSLKIEGSQISGTSTTATLNCQIKAAIF